MQIEQIVTSRTLSEKISQYKRGESLFWWVDKFPLFVNKCVVVTKKELDLRIENSILSYDAKKLIQSYPAYTATELGELMKDVDVLDFHKAYLELPLGGLTTNHPLLFTNPESLGEIYLYLLKSGVIK